MMAVLGQVMFTDGLHCPNSTTCVFVCFNSLIYIAPYPRYIYFFMELSIGILNYFLAKLFKNIIMIIYNE